ncbi:hypothetical protein LX64_02953 [Chitinophaga skermanii]|uniref:Uncharacterized protein n=1 Tax=Chitinophaga skermanii TaxID=331697 RepID=A0A327QHI5_9BACT|nr:hypothetical protein [Chitinophaga skermanii]RAJ04076.1 hypothetical protein LX64_02953 [Chitinophaga skermanii]
MNQFNFLIPENLDLDEIIKNNPIVDFKSFNREKLLYVLHLLADIPSNNKDLANEEGYVPINAEILKQWINKGYSRYLKYLIDAGIIETDNQFVVGLKSRGYRFCPVYQQPLKSIPVTNSILLKKMAKRNQSISAELTIDELPNGIDLPAIARKYLPIERWYNTGGLKINDKAAHSYNAEQFLLKKSDRSKWDKTVSARGFEWKNPFIQYLGGDSNIEKIKNGQFNAHFDKNVFRYHSALTSCKREIRNIITYDGERLVAIDLSNSQPTLLTLLLDHEFWLNESKGGKLNSSDIPYLFINPIFSTNNPFTNFITLVKKAQNNRITEGGELWNYYRMVGSGNFYYEFRQLLKEKMGSNYATNDKVKPMLFTDNRFIGQKGAKPKRIFRNLFPTIYEITSRIKKHGAKNLPILLQRIESYIMYHKVVP